MKFIDTHHDQWHRCAGEDGPVSHPAAADHLLLSLEQWHAVRDTWPATLAVGVQLPNDFDVEDLAADLPRLALIALNFPKWVDGRAYSQARLLRVRLRFAGEIRAVGEVLVDMVPLLARTGFDAAQLRPDQSVAIAQQQLAFFPRHYQGDVTEPKPAFADREAA
jgi:uncharacterized protein (DUF934 family)